MYILPKRIHYQDQLHITILFIAFMISLLVLFELILCMYRGLT
jgi:hypothetical protein